MGHGLFPFCFTMSCRDFIVTKQRDSGLVKTLEKSDLGEDVHSAVDADDLFDQLGI